MDLHYIENIMKIAELKSITKAAEQLYITQSALNQQLQKLEAELGTPLFRRNRSDWQLTDAGRIYIDSSRKILQIKKDTYNRISDIASVCNRQICIGLIPERGVDMFTAIYPAFHEQYPQVILEPVELNVAKMQRQISAGLIDLGLITLIENQKDNNTYFHMADEEIFLAVPASHPLAELGSKNKEEAPDLSLSRFTHDPFVRISKNSTMYNLEQNLFQQAGFLPHVLFSTASNISKYRMVSTGVCCAFIPYIFALPSENIRYFRAESHPKWEITIGCKRGRYLNKAEQTLLQLCREYWKTHSA